MRTGQATDTPPRPLLENCSTALLSLLQRCDVRLDDIAQAAGCTSEDAAQALDVDRFDAVKVLTLLYVRANVERLLHARGWQGSLARLWRQYDARMAASAFAASP